MGHITSCTTYYIVSGSDSVVNSPIPISPPTVYFYVSLIKMPGVEPGRVAPVPAEPLFHFRGVALNPTVNRGVVDIHAAFGQHLLQLTIADALFTVPANSPQDDFALKMATMERVHTLLLQTKYSISLSPPAICNSARSRV
jgi:hypothetical protein